MEIELPIHCAQLHPKKSKHVLKEAAVLNLNFVSRVGKKNCLFTTSAIKTSLGHMISKGRRHHGLPFLIGQPSCFPHNTFLFVKSDVLTLKLVLEMRKCWRGYARISFTKVHQESTYAQISEELISRVPDHF